MRGWLVDVLWVSAAGVPLLLGVAAGALWQDHEGIALCCLAAGSLGGTVARVCLEALVRQGREGSATLPDAGGHWAPPGDTRVRGK